jgi:hypothetical protein
MPAIKKQFWATFGDNQFPERLGRMGRRFWLKTLIGTSFSFTSDDDEPESDIGLVHVFDHSQVIPYIKLRKNTIIAVCPDEQWFLENLEEPRENFWLAKILSHHYSQRETVAQYRYRIQ